MNVLIASLALAATTLVPLNDLGDNPYMWGYYGGLWDVHNTGWVTVPAFQDMVASDPRVNHDSLVLLNAAAEGRDATKWDFPWKPTYNIVNSTVLPAANVTPQQVQAVWIQEINDSPTVPLPIQFADAYLLKATICDILREVKQQYPNTVVAYLSSPEYAGYNTTTKYLSEPFAYEDGIAVRLVLRGQIEYIQMGDQIWDPRIGPLDYNKGDAPWATWGPYLWANGTTPRSDGLTWERSDFGDDGVTLSDAGAAKSAHMLLDFVLHEPTAAPWLVPNGPVPPPPAKSRSVRVH